jgi:hypothetical protein
MSPLQEPSPEMLALLAAACEGSADSDEMSRLESLIGHDETAIRVLLDYFRLHAELTLRFRGETALSNSLQTLEVIIETGDGSDSMGCVGNDRGGDEPWPPSPIVALSGNAIHGAWNYFSSGWPVAYLVATVIFGLGLLIGAYVHVSQPVQVARQPLLPSRSAAEGKDEFVGRVTGMVDCQWADPHTAVPGLVAVPLGRKYELAFGLMEITYNTGAKVILQGPVTYEVESKAGGYLSVGKLTARLEKKAEENSTGSNPQSLIPNPSRSTIHHPLFTIKTPTATVTDLGTEFGVEVDKQGGTTSHVFRGLVELRPASDDGTGKAAARVLHENESARVENDGGNRVSMLGPAAKPADFVRKISKQSQTIKTFDLVDVVAGGDGFSGRRNRGIDPTTGQTVAATAQAKILLGDGRYHRVEGLSFVDGVFIPDGRRGGPVQTDSAGHTFDAFGNAFNETLHYIWAGGAIPADESGRVVPTVLGGVDYGSSGHSLLFMHANKGITFDLDAIRRANPSAKPVRFRAVVGNTETAAALAFRGSARATTFFADDFQAATAGTMPGTAQVGSWLASTPDATWVQVVSDVDPNSIRVDSNKCLKVHRPSAKISPFAWATGWTASDTDSQMVQMSASVWVPSGTDGAAFLDGHANQAFDGRSFTVYLGGDGSVKFYDGTALVATDLVSHPDTWQNVVVTANMATHRFSIKVDDQPLYTGGVWSSGATRVAYLLMGNEGSGGPVYFDNVRLGVPAASPTPPRFDKGEPSPVSADVWVLVDGERRSGRRGANSTNGAYSIVSPIADNDRFLTLVATDSGDGLYWDWVLFGDPRLEMAPADGQHSANLKPQ